MLVKLFQFLDTANGNPVKESLIFLLSLQTGCYNQPACNIRKESSQMLQGGISSYVIPLGRTLAGFIAALLLAFFGDITARVFNLAIGYPGPCRCTRTSTSLVSAWALELAHTWAGIGC